MEWDKLASRYGRNIIRSIWSHPDALIRGDYDAKGAFYWDDNPSNGISPHGWYGALQVSANPLDPWMAIDWDNPRSEESVAQAILRNVASLRDLVAHHGVPMLSWPSKSGRTDPHSQSQHLFVFLPNLTLEARGNLLTMFLGEILGRSIWHGRPEPTLRQEGLDPRGYFLYPSPGTTGIRMGLAAADEFDLFVAAWKRAFL